MTEKPKSEYRVLADKEKAFDAMLEALKKAYSLTAPLSTYGRELARVIEQAEAVRK